MPGRHCRRLAVAALALGGVGVPGSLVEGATTIHVTAQSVDIDARPDIDGVQATASAVKDVPAGVMALADGFSQDELQNLRVQGRLVGPGTDEWVETVPNTFMAFPRLQVAGTYTLTGVRLVDASSGVRIAERDPSAPVVVIEVIDEILVTQVTSRPLTFEEIQEKGIIITEENFSAVEFAVGLSFGSEEVEIELPVILPSGSSKDDTLTAPVFPTLGVGGSQPFETVSIPNLSVSGFSAQAPPDIESSVSIPDINGLIIIPGNIAFLNQFFSVMVLTLNTGPEGSGLVVQNARARAALPAGPDESLGTGDDPLRLASTNAYPDGLPDILPLLDAEGSDSLAPQRTHEAEFLVEGLREGTHRLKFDILGDLFVPALNETVPITGTAEGVVQVRNPTFSITLAHPDVVRDGEPYSIFATVTNTSTSPANLFEIGLNSRSLSGARLAEGGVDRHTLEQLLPGQAETFEFNLIAQTTGEVTGTVFLADDSINGSFLLTTGVGNTGIPLSPDTLVLPQVVDYIPDDPDLVFAVVRMLGQGYSVSTAPEGTLPPGVSRMRTAYVFDRGVKLAETGLHARFGESRTQGALDVLFDQLEGNFSDLERIYLDPIAELDPDSTDPGVLKEIEDAQKRYDDALADILAYDLLRRAADAGHNLSEVIGVILADAIASTESTTPMSLQELQTQMTSWFGSAPLGFLSYGSTNGALELSVSDLDDRRAGFDPTGTLKRDRPRAAFLPLGADGSSLIVEASPDTPLYRFEFIVSDGDSSGEVSITLPDQGSMALLTAVIPPGLPSGTFAQAIWPLGGDPAGIAFEVDYDGDGIVDDLIVPTVNVIADAPATVLGVYQWGRGNELTRPPVFETGDPAGRLAAVLFSEPVLGSSVQANAFSMDAHTISGVSIQPSKRLAFVMTDEPFGPFIPRQLRVESVLDRAELSTDGASYPVTPNPERGVGGVVRGRILEPDGTPVPFATVKYVQTYRCEQCLVDRIQDVIVSSVLSDINGNYELEYVLQNTIRRDFQLEVLDPSTGHPGRAQTHVRYDGQEMRVDVIIRGYGSIVGRLLDEDGAPIAGESPTSSDALLVTARNLSTGEVATSWVDENGNYAFPSSFSGDDAFFSAPLVPVGNVALKVVRPADGATAISTTNVPAAGVTVEHDLVLADFNRFGSVEGRVVEADGFTGAAGVRVQIAAPVLSSVRLYDRTYVPRVIASVETDESGRYRFEDVPIGDIEVYAFRQNTYEEARAKSFLEDGQNRVLDLVFPGSGASVAGTVYDANGTPLANATVAGGPTLTTTDASGNFVIDGLPLGTFTIAAQPDHGSGVGRATVSLTSPSDAPMIAIFIEPLGRITGTVTDADGAIVPAQEVQLWTDRPDALMARVFTDESGQYNFTNYPLGAFSVRAVTQDFGDGGMANTEIRFEGDARDADIQFRGLGSVSGTVVQPTGGGTTAGVIADVIVRRQVWRKVDANAASVFDNYYVEYVELLAEEFGNDIQDAFDSGFQVGLPPAFFILNTESALTRSDILGPNGEVTGRFEFRDSITGGPFTVTAQNAFAGPGSATGEIPKTLIAAERSVELAAPIVLEPTTGSVEGVVYMPDGVTPVGADVAVDVGPLIRVTTDESGFYRAPLVPTGTAVTTADTLAPAEPALDISTAITDEFTALNVRLYAQTRAVVPPGDAVIANLRLQDVAGLAVQVVDSEGLPVPQALVTLQTASSLDRAFDTNQRVGALDGFRDQVADGAGAIAFFPVIEGRYSVSARHPTLPASGQFTGTVAVNPENHTRYDVVVQLGAVSTDSGEPPVAAPGFGTVEGTVFKADGAPLTNPSEVTILTSGARIITTSDESGFYRIEFVPEGGFQLDVFEPATARIGEANGRVYADETTRADVTLVGLGSVAGTVYFADRTSIAANASIVLFPSGNFSAPLVTTADLNGAYSLPGIPLGPYTVEAQDLISGLRGSSTGQMLVDGGEIGTDVYIDPSGSIVGTVYTPNVLVDSVGNAFLPDGTTPCDASCLVPFADIRLTGPESRNTQADQNGRFDSGLYLPIGTYTLTATIPGGGDGQRMSVSLGADGEAPDVPVVLRGGAIVSGVVLDSTGTSPIDSAQLTIQSRSQFARGDQSVQTNASGEFTFVDVPVGEFLVSATKTIQSIPLGTSKVGEVLANGENVVWVEDDALLLQETGEVGGLVFLADGVSLAEGAIATAVSSNAQTRVSAAVKSDGRFEFVALPVGSYVLTIRDAPTNAQASVAINTLANGEARDLGSLTLDDTPPTVVTASPEVDATNVDPGVPEAPTGIELLVSELIRPQSVDAISVQVLVAGAPVAGELTSGPDSIEPMRTRIVFTPSVPFPDLARVTVVLPAEVRDFEGELTSIGITDLAGFGLVSEYRSSFSTSDTTPPGVVSVSPAASALEVDPSAVLRVEFNEAIDTSQVAGFSLSRDGVDVSGNARFAQDDTVAIFVPDGPLLPNGDYTAELTGPIADLPGNVRAEPSIVWSFRSIDTTPPIVTDITYPPTATREGGSTLSALAVTVSDVRSVDFFVDGVLVGQDTSAPFEWTYTLPEQGSAVLLGARPIDLVGNAGPLFAKNVPLEVNAPPVVAFTGNTTVFNDVPKSIGFTLNDSTGLVRVSFAADGGRYGSESRTLNGDTAYDGPAFIWSPPRGLPNDAPVTVVVTAEDARGVRGSATRTYPITDRLAPNASVVSPADGMVVSVGEQLSIVARAEDGGGLDTMALTVSGAFNFSESRSLGETTGLVQETFTVTVPTSVAPNVPASIEITATDLGGTSTSSSIVLIVRDQEGPRLVSLVPGDLENNVPGFAPVLVEFDEIIDTGTVGASSFGVSGPAGAIQGTLSWENNNRRLRFTPESAYEREATYSLTVTPEVTDLSGNAVALLESEFSVTRFDVVAPAGAAPAVEGDTLTFAAEMGSSRDVQTVTVEIDGTSVGSFLEEPFLGEFNVPTLITNPGLESADFDVQALANYGAGIDFFSSPRSLTVHRAAGDADLDQMTNALERSQGTDPFVDDADADPDGDGLMNRIEALFPTDPFLADTDGDGLGDGAEDANANGQVDAGESDPRDPDTDGDGVDDGSEVAAGTDPTVPNLGLNTTGATEPVLLSGRNVYPSIFIAAGTTVRAVGDEPLELVSGSTFIVEGTIDVSGADGADAPDDTTAQRVAGGQGVAGGANGGDGAGIGSDRVGTDGAGPGGGGGGEFDPTDSQSLGGPGGGGGFGSPGVASFSPTYGGRSGDSYSGLAPTWVPDTPLSADAAGSGGGGGGKTTPESDGLNSGGGGGAGGGVVYLSASDRFEIRSGGQVLANGGSGGDGAGDPDGGSGGGGGGGSGGYIWLEALYAVVDGTVSATGGSGGTNGTSGGLPLLAGRGGFGRIRIDAPQIEHAGVVSPDAAIEATEPPVVFFGVMDYDQDGRSNAEELLDANSDLFLYDTDGDGLNDGYEYDNGLQVSQPDATDDPDGDGITNINEQRRGSDPLVSDAVDVDGDGLSTELELALGTDPYTFDTDGDGLNDGQEDANLNGIRDLNETSPLVADSDRDGITDDVDPDSFDGVLDTSGLSTLELVGTHIFAEIVIRPETTITGAGRIPLQLISLTDLTVNGTIDVSGGSGGSGKPNSSEGGAPGAGRAGGNNGSTGRSGVAYALGGVRGRGPGGGQGGQSHTSDPFAGQFRSILADYGGGGGYADQGSGSLRNQGQTYGDAELTEMLGGSGGGSGGSIYAVFEPGVSDGTSVGGGGGAGGGFVMLYAAVRLEVGSTGRVLSLGGDGGAPSQGGTLPNSTNSHTGGSGGGGSGGAIWLRAPLVANEGIIQALGGSGGLVEDSSIPSGGEGGLGRIRVDSDIFLVSGIEVPSAEFALSCEPEVGFFGVAP